MTTPAPKLNIELRVSWNSELIDDPQIATMHRLIDLLTNDPTNAVTVAVTDVGSAADPPKRVRGRPPTARKANGDAGDAPPAQVDVAGDNTPQDEADEDDPGLREPSMTGQEALELAKGGARLMFNANQKELVATIRKQLGAAKWDDVPPSEGHRALKLIREAAAKLGMHV